MSSQKSLVSMRVTKIINQVHYIHRQPILLEASTNFTTCCEHFHGMVSMSTRSQNKFHQIFNDLSNPTLSHVCNDYFVHYD
jgi:hypothetical protein